MDPKLALIDMDGTIYSGSAPIHGVNQALEFLESKGIGTFFLTNYAGTKRSSYKEKLQKMGIEASWDQVVTSGWLTAKYLNRNFPEAEIFVLGEEDLEEEIREEGLNVQETCEKPDVLVVSNKHDLSYGDLKDVLQGIGDGTEIIGTNPDETIPGESGDIPGAGTIIQAVEAMTGKDAEVIGKPSKNGVKTVTNMMNVPRDRCLMIGDRLNTDILMGEENGMETVLVLSGVTDRKEVAGYEVQPDHVLKSIANIDEIF